MTPAPVCRASDLLRQAPLDVLLLAPDPGAQAHALRAAGAAVTTLWSLDAADEAARSGRHEVIALDVAGREEAAIAVLAGWRRAGLDAPVLLLTGPAGAAGVKGLDAGADTFLPRTAPAPVLLAHLCALARLAWRRTEPVGGAVLRVEDLEIDLAARVVRRGGLRVPLTRREFAALELLALRRGRAVRLAELLAHTASPGGANAARGHIRNLRRKLDAGRARPLLLTLWGEGYILRRDEG